MPDNTGYRLSSTKKLVQQYDKCLSFDAEVCGKVGRGSNSKIKSELLSQSKETKT
jgi:hypothetical protein